MKILLANNYFYIKGGSEAVFFNTAKLLEKKGHELVYFSMDHPSNLPSSYSKYFVSNIDYSHANLVGALKAALNILYSFEAKHKIGRLLEADKPDIAHIHNIYHRISPSILHAFKKIGVPVIMTLHDCKMVCASYLMVNKGKPCEKCKGGRYYKCFLEACVRNSRAKSLLNTIEMYLHHSLMHIYSLIDVFISPSRFLAQKIKDMGFKGTIIHLPDFIFGSDFTPGYNWVDRSIVYFGRLSQEKGLSTLINSVRGLDIKLKLIGEGPIKERLESRVREEGLNNIEFLGYRQGDDLKTEIRNAMFVVLPSECYENNPRSIIEGFALGKPVIGARIGGIPEIIKDGENGLLFRPGSVTDLRAKIEALLSNHNKLVEMGKSARTFVEIEFNEGKHYEKLMEIYHSAIKRCKPPGVV